MLTPEQYDRAEQEARKTTCNRIIEASACEVFNMRGYPTRIKDTRELWRYVDCMQEGRTEKIFNEFLNGLSVLEFERLKFVTEKVYKHIGIVPTASVLWSILAWRNIKPFLQEDDMIFEVGGGSGYLGVFLGLDGFRYMSTDVCQGFYIWQSNLMELFFGNDFNEYISEENGAGKFFHIPYWKYMKLDNSFFTDCVVANDMITEMSWESMQYMIKHSKFSLDFGSGKLFYVQGVGLQHRYTFKSLLGIFEKRGIIVDYADKHNLTEEQEKDPIFYWMKTKGNLLNAEQKVKEIREEVYPIKLDTLMDFYYSLSSSIISDDEKFYNYCNL